MKTLILSLAPHAKITIDSEEDDYSTNVISISLPNSKGSIKLCGFVPDIEDSPSLSEHNCPINNCDIFMLELKVDEPKPSLAIELELALRKLGYEVVHDKTPHIVS